MDRCGFIFTTYNDSEEVKAAYESFVQSLPTNYSFSVAFTDAGSTDEHLKEIGKLGSVIGPNIDLSSALNAAIYSLLGFDKTNIENFTDGSIAGNVDYVFWLHPDMRFWQKEWHTKLIQIYKECWPLVGKLGPGTSNIDGSINNLQKGEYIWEGNQCPWVMSATVIRDQLMNKGHVFDPRYIRCGGYEDWNLNADLLSLGYAVCITGLADVWHKGMGSRATYDTSPHQRRNAEIFSQIFGSGQQPGGQCDLAEINDRLKVKFKDFADEVIFLKSVRDKMNA